MGCLCCLSCCKHIELMISKDNPNRICKEKSTCRCIGLTILWTLIISALIIAFYFFTVWFGYGMTATVKGNEYNMDTGTSLDPNCNSNCNLVCAKDYAGGLYAGCFFIGLLCDFILVVLIALIVFVIWLTCNIKNEVVKASDTAQNMNTHKEVSTSELRDVKITIPQKLVVNEELSNVELEE